MKIEVNSKNVEPCHSPNSSSLTKTPLEQTMVLDSPAHQTNFDQIELCKRKPDGLEDILVSKKSRSQTKVDEISPVRTSVVIHVTPWRAKERNP